jgi:hypothetical protein
MRRGMCLLVKEQSVYGVRVDAGGTWTSDMTIPEYEQKGIQPPWRTLAPCPGMSADTMKNSDK